jgi:hypothetical protein
MSTAAMTLLSQGLVHSGPTPAALRILLLPGEVLALPRSSSRIRVLSGAAWVSKGGRDLLLATGERMDTARGRDRPVVSGLGTEVLLFELL